jgi:hypothetical protein
MLNSLCKGHSNETKTDSAVSNHHIIGPPVFQIPKATGRLHCEVKGRNSVAYEKSEHSDF